MADSSVDPNASRAVTQAVTDRSARVAQAGRWIVIAAIVAVTSYVAWFFTTHRPQPSDIYQLVESAKALGRGENPYTLVGPDGPIVWPFKLFYPLTAIVVVWPLAWLPQPIADVVFVALSTTGLAWLALRGPRVSPFIWVFASFAYVSILAEVQWSALIVVATFAPALGWLLAAKPSIAAALWIAYPSRPALLGAAFFAAVVSTIWPWWIPAWLDAMQAGGHFTRPPVTLAGGPLILAALWRWRDPDARLLAALACVPHTTYLYEAIPLFLIPKTHVEGALLAALTAVCKFAWNSARPIPSYEVGFLYMGTLMVWLLYLPCLVMVLRRRPSRTPHHAENREHEQPEQQPAHASTLP